MKKLLFILILLSDFLLSNTNQKITLQLNWLHQFQFAGYYMAKEKGFYKNVGLDVDIKEYTFKTNLLEEIDSKRANFAIGRSSLLIDKINGKDIIALGAVFQESPLVLLVKEDSNINSVNDLKNKRIMLTSDTRFSASILAMLSANGLKEGDYITQKHSFDLNDLISGKTDAMASYLSNEPIILKDKNIKYKIFNPKDFGFQFYSDILFTSANYIKNNPKVTKDFYDASIKGWEYAFDNLAETAEIIHTKYNSQNKSLIHLIKEGEILKKLAYVNDEGIGHINEMKLSNIINVFKLFGLVSKDIDIGNFIYDENPYKTLNLQISKQDRMLIIIILFFIFFTFCLIIFFFKKTSQIKRLLHTVINSTDDLIFYKDNKLKYIGCNKSFEKLIGKTEAEIIGKDDFEIFDKKFATIFRKNDLKVLKAKAILSNDEWLNIEEEQKIFQTKKIPFSYNKYKRYGILGISRDITNLYKIQEKLREQAYHDELTGIFNRKSYNEKIEEKFDLYKRYKAGFCVAMYDIDNFKNINDTYGHDMGDKVLKEMTKVTKENIRKTDLLFRIGGEEFVIIFPKTKIEEGFLVAEKIREIISNLVIIPKEKITISIGITQTKKEDTIQSIYERIDKLMYESKINGKNQTSKG
uniref:diguanylate cyclase n=1 Tax=Aliarcobacter sp. TaxID=2321116 RepID=UPI004047AF93